jgi:hypothetical protein
MSKKLNVAAIANELEESAFFRRPERKQPAADTPTPLPEQPMVQEERVGGRGTVPPPVPQGVPQAVPLVPKVRRPIRQRQPFDIYEDQYEQLKSIAAAERGFVNGRGMSQMVRDAIDQYLRDHASPKK